MRRHVTLVAACVVLAATRVAGGPLYDPFLERFQVGRYSDPRTVVLKDAYPADLFLPAEVDSVWLQTALVALDPARAPLPGADLARRLLPWFPQDAGLPLPDEAVRTLRLLGDGFEAPDQLLDAARLPWLDAELRSAAFHAAMRIGNFGLAVRLAQEAADGDVSDRLSARERFIWRLRANALTAATAGSVPAAEMIWPEVLELAPYDAGNAWSLWVARRRAGDARVLAPPETSSGWLRFLGGLGRSWLTADDIRNSDLSEEWRAGLGAVLLGRSDLAAHFERHADPPHHITLQGHWVRGRRALRSGQADDYETLASREDLRPAWRLDVWRRASELRLLHGDWSVGLEDLEQALTFSRRGNGTNSLRRRLRQWVEQALVLALAQERPDTARRLHDMGLRGFTGEEKAAFVTETRHWNARLGIVGGPVPARGERTRVEAGTTRDIRPARAQDRVAFDATVERDAWKLWARWGLALVDTSAVTGERRARAARYVRALAGISSVIVPEPRALAAFAPHLTDPYLWQQAVDRDVAVLSGGRTPPRRSRVPEIAAANRHSNLSLHALLGFALAVGDMRGTLAVATLLPPRGLTEDERRTFLYPLPARGPIRDALSAAENEPALLLAVARNESLFEPAVRSRAGALGWMQIMPFHYQDSGAVPGAGNWRCPAVSIARGDALLTEAQRRYDGDPYRVLAAYNAGPGATDRWDDQLGGQAPRDIYLAWIGYPETRRYVEKVLIDREIYTAIIGGPDSNR